MDAARLRELQGFLITALRRGEPIQEDAALATSTGVFVAGNERLTPAEQADLYREQFWLRHLASLSEDYPGLRAVVGEDRFESLARAYLVAHPPRTPSLRDLAADLSSFAAGWPGLAGALREPALEMLAYEDRFTDLFDGADVPPLDASKLTAMGEDAWEGARLVLHPLLARLELHHAVHLFRLAVLGREAHAALPERRDVNLVLYRGAGEIRYDELEADAFKLLGALAAGKPLGPACEEIARGLADDAAERFVAKVGGWFQDWTAKGWIVDVMVSAPAAAP